MNKDKQTPGNEQKTGIDWDEVHSRIEKMRVTLEQGASPSPEETRSILKKRARALAQEPKQAESSQNFLEIVEFRLSREIYGIESAFVREVYPLRDLTTLPCTPSFVLGIINVRGQILSVIDLKKFFNLQEKGLGDLNKVIILHNEKMEFGILADVIIGTFQIPHDAIQPPLPTVTGIGAEYLKGVTGDRIIVLDGDKILGDEKMVIYEETELDALPDSNRRNMP
jgi:purine-binding chemotaxis protein CheW